VPITGKSYLTHKLGGIRRSQVDRAATPWIDRFQRMIAEAEAQLGGHGVAEPGGRIVEVSRTSYTIVRPGSSVELNGRARLVTRPNGQQLLVKELPVASDATVSASQAVEYLAVIELEAIESRAD
jgi:hypothetical protein